MIRSFRHKGLAELWETGKSGKVDARLHKRVIIRLRTLNAAAYVEDVNLPGYNFHALQGFDPQRFTIHINGPWCLTFSFEKSHALLVDLEQYH